MDSDFYIGDRRVRFDTAEIEIGGERRRVDRMAINLLVFLASRAPHGVSRSELLETVWSGRVVGDEVLTAAVSRLRRALKDDAAAPRFIETLNGYGYRIAADVRSAEDFGAIAAATGRGWRRLGAPLQFASASLFGIGAYLFVVCVLLA